MPSLSSSRVLLSHAPPQAYAPMTRVILGKLGYLILLPEEIESLGPAEPIRPVLRLLDERQLAELPDEDDGVPVVLLTGRHGVTGADPRIAGAVKRPAGMHEMYRLIQQLTEETPRSTPRVATHLVARCHKSGREWKATVLSLSENGCLVRSPEPMLLGGRVDLSLDLPRLGAIELEAETAYQLLPDVGMIFNGTPAPARQAIVSFVTRTLMG